MDSPGEEDLCQRVFDLWDKGISRVKLTGEAGTGKTRVANEVCKRAKEQALCYLTLWLHLNKKFDKRSLYEDIAAQLHLFHEYEETDDDYDGKEKDEEKEDLQKLKAKIMKELQDKMNPNEGDKKPESSGKEKKPTKGENKPTKGENKKSASSKEEKQLAAGQNAEGEKNSTEGKKSVASAGEKNSAEGAKKSASSAGKKYLLLILNDEGHLTKEEEVMTDLGLEKFLEPYGPIKILMTTRRTRDDSSTNHQGEAGSTSSKTSDNSGEIEDAGDDKVGETGPLAQNSSQPSAKPVTDNGTQALLVRPTDREMQALLDSLTKHELMNSLKQTLGIEDSKMISTIEKMSLGLPAEVVVLSKSLDRIANIPSPEEYVKKVFKQVVPFESYDAAAGSKSEINLFHLGYELLKGDDTLKSATVACFWHSLDFFTHCGGVYYRDLITHWILEGYFDPVRSVEKAYQDGHYVLLELINRGILKIQENNVVVPEVAMSNLIDPRYHGFFGSSSLGFSRVYVGEKAKGLGRITVVDDVIKTVQTNKSGERLSTILVSGNRLRRETPYKFFKEEMEKHLEVLGLFNPTLESLVQYLSKLKQLRVLVIRDYDLLDSIDYLAGLEQLQVLEVSGASSLKNIKGDFFKEMSKLESLNLSGLGIKSSPPTISTRRELRCLILRNCPELEDLPDLQDLKKLEVVDCRGARELKTCFDKEEGTKKNKSKNKNFYRLRQLKHLDFSESQIERLPIFQDAAEGKELHSLTRLLLRNCSKLRRLPNLKPLSGLQVLDLSGTSSLLEMLEVCFEEKKALRILNLSGSNLRELPSTISELSNLTQFLLKDCSKLEALPNIEELTRLEEFDVSGCTKLEKIEGSFKRMSYLCKLNLRGTIIKAIPELPEHSSLCCSKYIVLQDSRCAEGEDWRGIKERLPSGMFESSTSSDAGAETSEISEEESGSRERHSNETRSSVCPEKKDECKELVYHGNRYETLQKRIRLFIDPKSPLKIEEIPSCGDPSGFSDNDQKRISKAEFASFVDNVSTSVSSVFNEFQMTSVKGCWVNRCKKMENLLLVEHEKHVESMETLWVSNLPSLKSLCGGSPEHGFFKNLKKISIDCCPNIEMLFPASQLPPSLEEVYIKFCDKLKKVFDQDGEVPNVKKLSIQSCPKIKSLFAASKLPTSLEILHISSCSELDEVFDQDGKVPNLKKVSIHCCPKIKTLFPAPLLPTSLEEMHIRFCNKLEKVFGQDGQVPTLKTLHLFELPLLSAVGATLPNRKEFTTLKCPKLTDEEDGRTQGSTPIQTAQQVPHENPDSDWVWV